MKYVRLLWMLASQPRTLWRLWRHLGVSPLQYWRDSEAFRRMAREARKHFVLIPRKDL